MKKVFVLLLVLVAVAGLIAKPVNNLQTTSGTPGDNRGITVTAPNGGEIWQIGTIHQITWTYTETQGPFRIDLFRGANSTTPVINIAENVMPSPNGILFNWTIPATLTVSAEYKVRVSYTGNSGGMVSDLSNNYFSITAANPSTLTVTSPNGGENWALGSTHEIHWTTPMMSGNARIQLYRGMNTPPVLTIAENVFITNESFTWTIPTTLLASNEYRIRVGLLNSETMFDYSDNPFTLSGGNTAAITVTSPNGGENWATGTIHPITWNFSQNTGPFRIDLFRGANSTAPVMGLAENILPDPSTNSGIFHWNIPATLIPSSEYKVRVSSISADGVSYADFSNEFFTISTGTPASLQLIAPNGGENWVLGTMHVINWVAPVNTGNIKIQLLRGDMPIINIAENVPAGMGNFSWMIPNNLVPAENFKIRIILLNTENVSDDSNGFFTISQNNTSVINLTSPNGGENWVMGTVHEINWTTPMLSGNARIQLFRGLNTPQVMTIAENVFVSNGTFAWTIPTNLLASGEYKVKITMINSEGIFDYSNGNFTISGGTAPGLTVIYPNGGENFTRGTSYSITWGSAMNAGNVRIELYRNNERVRFIAENTPNDGVHPWIVPAELPTGSGYKIKITYLAEGTAIFDMSNEPFSVSNSQSRTSQY